MPNSEPVKPIDSFAYESLRPAQRESSAFKPNNHKYNTQI